MKEPVSGVRVCVCEMQIKFYVTAFNVFAVVELEPTTIPNDKIFGAKGLK